MLLTILAAGAIAQAVPAIDPATKARIDAILADMPVIDGHNDVAWESREHRDYSTEGLARDSGIMTDMARLHAGGVGGQLWSVYISAGIKGDEAIRQTMEQLDFVDRMIEAYPDDLAWATSADDVLPIHQSGKVASFAGVEGGHQIGGNLAALRQFHRLGARYMTLTHSKTTGWADSATDVPKHGGLSPFGEQVVREMNRVGILVDLSHVSEEAMNDALDVTRAPVIFSHSSARAIGHHPRNVPDSVLKRLPDNGGVVMVTFVPPFISDKNWQWFADREAAQARFKMLNPADSEDDLKARLESWMAANPEPKVTVAMVADHIDHIARVAGHDHVGIGSDFDGITFTVDGLANVADYPNLFAELIRRGWSDDDLKKLAGGNILRALRGAEAVAAAMQGQAPSLDKPDMAD